MTTAKPQQFSDRTDPSDDLIAELARMMAQEAQGDTPAPASGPVTTPPAEQNTPSPSTLRIPGISEGPGEGVPAPRPSFDFGRAPTAAPVVTGEPLSSWQNRSAPKPAARQEPALQAETFVPQEQPARKEPDFGLSAAPRQPAPRVEAQRSDDNFNFSFDLPKTDHGHDEDGHRTPSTRETDEANYDAIADLIAAELEHSDEEQLPLEIDEELMSVEAGEENIDLPPPAQEPAVAPEPAPAPVQPSANPMLRPVNFQARETAPTDRFSVSPVFGLGGRANPKAINPTPVAAPPPVQQQAPAPTPPVAPQARPFAEQPPTLAPSHREEPVAAARAEPTPMPRHQPIGPAMAAIAPHVSHASTDPMDEIESLLGEAVRVELSPQLREQSTPIVASLNAPFAPQRTSIPLGRTEPRAMTSEDAILAAAAASGRENMERWDVRAAEYQSQPEPRGKKEKAGKAPKAARAVSDELPRRSGGMRRYVGPAVALTMLVVAGLGLYWVLGMGHTDGTAPVLTADTAAVKEVPPAATPDTNAASGSAVFNEIDGGAAADNQEQIVSRDQTSGEDVARVIAPESDETGLANRKVRTVTVRPDGTIVTSGDDALAGAEILPVDRPNVPTVPGQAADASDLLTGTPPTQAAAAPALTGTPALATPSAGAFPVTSAAGAPVPMPRPTFRNGNASIQQPASPVSAMVAEITPPADANSQIVDLIGNLSGDTPAAAPAAATVRPAVAVEQVAAVAPALIAPQAAAQPAAPVDTASPAAAYAQLSSQRSEQDAINALDNINRRFANLFGGVLPEIKRVDLGAKGIFYRVRLPATSMSAASQVCSDVKLGGGDCFPTK